ncbi:hypothetical protein ACRAR1_01670 [Streptomyces sanyensis]|uniref:hypothetical protein n=1 Tax=Streptomyces sanyensis TaxID=568869 RepID=UPI003D774C5B
MAPGWKHKDGRVTPAGLIGTRTGRGAATDRLALLLLVLEARETGRVRQCGGTVDTKRGRAATTVARLLGCSASAGERVLERLEDRELVLRVRLKTGSGLANRSRLMVPAVAAAHGRTVGVDVQEDRSEDLEPEFSDPDVAAGPSEAPGLVTEPQVSGVPVTDEADVAEPDVAAALHTDHPHLVTSVVPPQLSCGFSGEGRGADGRRPERACAGEDQAADGESAAPGTGWPVAEDGPLRGEQPKESPVDERGGQRAAGAGADSRPKAAGWENAQQQRRVGLPADLRLRVALGPVAWLWERLSGWQQDQVEAAAKAELAGLGVAPEGAPRLLADRLTDRLAETGGEARVDKPFPWLIRRGLPQRRACSHRKRDDGVRLDTGEDCENCGNVMHLRRARRARIGTKARWIAPRLIAAANSAVPEANVRAVHVLAPAARTTTTAMSSAAVDDPAPQRAVPAGPERTRESASDGYHRALAAHRAVAPPRQEDSALAAAVVRQEQVRRELAATAFPDIEQDQEDEVPMSLEDVRAQQRQAAEAVRAAAIRRARAERAGQADATRSPTLRQAG